MQIDAKDQMEKTLHHLPSEDRHIEIVKYLFPKEQTKMKKWNKSYDLAKMMKSDHSSNEYLKRNKKN